MGAEGYPWAHLQVNNNVSFASTAIHLRTTIHYVAHTRPHHARLVQAHVFVQTSAASLMHFCLHCLSLYLTAIQHALYSLLLMVFPENGEGLTDLSIILNYHVSPGVTTKRIIKHCTFMFR